LITKFTAILTRAKLTIFLQDTLNVNLEAVIDRKYPSLAKRGWGRFYD